MTPFQLSNIQSRNFHPHYTPYKYESQQACWSLQDISIQSYAPQFEANWQTHVFLTKIILRDAKLMIFLFFCSRRSFFHIIAKYPESNPFEIKADFAHMDTQLEKAHLTHLHNLSHSFPIPTSKEYEFIPLLTIMGFHDTTLAKSYEVGQLLISQFRHS